MNTKSFVLRRESYSSIVAQCTPGTIAVIRPEKALETLFRNLIHKVVEEKQPAYKEIKEVSSYFDAVTDNPQYKQKKQEFISYVEEYLNSAIGYKVNIEQIEDYVLAQSAVLCAQAVAIAVKVEAVDGRELVVCHQEGVAPIFDWNATREEIEHKCQGKNLLVISGGYARTPQGMVVSVGKGGANMMASLIAASVNAERIEFYVEGEGIHGIEAMTYDEAAHYCAVSNAPFPSAALWPAKNAGIPIIVKSIQHPEFQGTRISANAKASKDAISGIIADSDLILVTVYGTGLLGQVGASSIIFSSLAKAGVNIRFIAQTSSEYSISFAVREKYGEKVSEVLKQLFNNNPLIPLDDVMIINQKVGIITVYGSLMKNVPGISGTVFSLLGKAGINVIASAQGGEELSISVVLDVNDLNKAKESLDVL